MNFTQVREHNDLLKRMKELEERVAKLEVKRKPGRPRKTNGEAQDN